MQFPIGWFVPNALAIVITLQPSTVAPALFQKKKREGLGAVNGLWAVKET